MATLDVTTTLAWVDIKTSLTLVQGSSYVIDNVTGGKVGTAYVREGSIAPTSLMGHPIEIGESRVVTITSEKLWIRSNIPGINIVLTVEA